MWIPPSLVRVTVTPEGRVFLVDLLGFAGLVFITILSPLRECRLRCTTRRASVQ